MNLPDFDGRIRSMAGGFAQSESQLGIFRWVYGFLMLFVVGIPNYAWLNRVPEAFYQPPTYSLAALLDGFPGGWFFLLLSLLVPIVFLLLMFGWRTPYVSLAATFLLLLGNSFKFSLGKIDHDILMVLFPALMAFSGWGNAYSLDAQRGDRARPRTDAVMWVAVVLAFGMFSSGFVKMYSGWLDPHTWAIKGFIQGAVVGNGRTAFLTEEILALDQAWFWEGLDYLVIFFEFAFLPLLLFPRWFRRAIPALFLFHLSTTLFMNVSFFIHLPVYLVFFPWEKFETESWGNWLNKWLGRREIRALSFGLLVVLVVWQSWLGTSAMVHPRVGHPTFLLKIMRLFDPMGEYFLPLAGYSLAFLLFLIAFIRPQRKR